MKRLKKAGKRHPTPVEWGEPSKVKRVTAGDRSRTEKKGNPAPEKNGSQQISRREGEVPDVVKGKGKEVHSAECGKGGTEIRISRVVTDGEINGVQSLSGRVCV